LPVDRKAGTPYSALDIWLIALLPVYPITRLTVFGLDQELKTQADLLNIDGFAQ